MVLTATRFQLQTSILAEKHYNSRPIYFDFKCLTARIQFSRPIAPIGHVIQQNDCRPCMYEKFPGTDLSRRFEEPRCKRMEVMNLDGIIKEMFYIQTK